MGGRIGADSTLGVGSCFWFEVNAADPPSGACAGPTSLPDIARAPAATGARTVLYIEDNAANLALVERIVARRPDLRLLSALTARLGIDIAIAQQPDVILMDIHLPGMSGLQALAQLAQDPATMYIPVIALSASAMPRDVEHGLAAGFYRYVTKPIRVNDFMRTLDLALERGPAPAARRTSEEIL